MLLLAIIIGAARGGSNSFLFLSDLMSGGAEFIAMLLTLLIALFS